MAHVLFLLLTNILTSQAQTYNEYQPFADRSNSILSCWGDEDASVDILAGAEPTNDGPTKPLAAFCATSLAVMECGFDQDPTHPYYGGVGFYTQGGHFLSNLAASPYSPEWREQYSAMLACHTKCTCKGQDPITLSTQYNTLPVNQTYEYNFDRRQPIARLTSALGANDHPIYFYGFNSAFQPGRYNMDDRPPPRFRPSIAQDIIYAPPNTAQNVVSLALVGMRENAPFCDSVEGTLDSVFPEQLSAFINLHGIDNAPKDATSLCAHTLYGGKDKDNLGAICLRQDDSSRRTLSINSIRKAPQYTTDYYQTGLHPTLAVQLLEIFCFAACHCSGEEDDVRQQRLDAWNVRTQQAKAAGSNDNKELMAEQSSVEISVSTTEPVGITKVGSGSSSTFQQQQCQINNNGGSCPSCDTSQACTSAADCGTGCTCQVQPNQNVLNFLNSAAVVLAACVIKVLSDASTQGSGKNPKRGIGATVSEHYCACNATYISGGCCTMDRGDGIIWESQDQNILTWSELKT